MSATIEPWEPSKRISAQTARNHPCVDYVVLSEFDIDVGSTVRHQYPSTISSCSPDWLAEHCIPEGIHARDSDGSYLFINRKAPVLQTELLLQEVDKETERDKQYFLFGLNICRTKKDTTVKRGAVVKSIAIFSRWSFVESFKWILTQGLENYFNDPTIDTLKSLFEAINSINLEGTPLPSAVERHLMCRNVARVDKMVQAISERAQNQKTGERNNESDSSLLQYCQPSHWAHSLPLEYNDDKTLDILILPHLGPDEVGDINVVKLLRTLHDHTLTVFNALLKGKRVMVVGHGHSAKDLAQFVLSAVSLAATASPGLLRRAYPYVNLSDLGFLEGKWGYIAGTTNPMFAQREEWWDVLVEFESPGATLRRARLSEELARGPGCLVVTVGAA